MNDDARPRRVAMVTDWFKPRMGGIEVHIAELAAKLLARGQDIRIVTSTPGAAAVEGFAVTQLPGPLLPGLDLAISPRLIEQLKADFVANRYDVIHAHISIASPVGFGAVLAAHALGLPTIASFHSVLLRTVDVLRSLDRLVDWSGWPVVAVGVSGLIAKQLRMTAPVLDPIVIPNGVDRTFWRPAVRSAGGRAGNKVQVVSAMRLHRKKRPLALLTAFARARTAAAARGRTVTLRIAGDGAERKKLENYAVSQGLGGSVTFLGAVSRDKLLETYRGADLFALASIREAFGLAALEARCVGLPVVGMRAAGITEFLVHGDNALLAGDDTEFAQFLERLVLDDDLRAMLAQSKRGLERFDWPAVIDAHVACQDRAIAAVKARRGETAR